MLITGLMKCKLRDPLSMGTHRHEQEGALPFEKVKNDKTIGPYGLCPYICLNKL